MLEFYTTTTAGFTRMDAVGVTGFALYVLGYLLLALRCLGNESRLYYGLNFLAAGCVLVSLSENFNLASAMIQVFWISISALGLSLSYVRVRSCVRRRYSAVVEGEGDLTG